MAEWKIPERPSVGDRKPHKTMAETALVQSGDGRLYCRCCRSHFDEQDLREKKMSLRFCSSCNRWNGVADLLREREEKNLEVFYQLGFFEKDSGEK